MQPSRDRQCGRARTGSERLGGADGSVASRAEGASGVAPGAGRGRRSEKLRKMLVLRNCLQLRKISRFAAQRTIFRGPGGESWRPGARRPDAEQERDDRSPAAL